MKIPDKYYNRFDGGVRRDKSPYDLKDNELQRGRNFIIDEQGRIKKRRGSRQFGQNLEASAEPIAMHYDANGFFVAINAATPIVYKLQSATLTTAITTASTSISTSNSGFNAGPSVVEIEGDLITYQSGGGTTTLATVTGITSSHAVGAAINQWISVGTFTDADASSGVWFTYLNGLTTILFGGGVTGAQMFTYDGTNIASVSGEPTTGARLLENFRDRIYTVIGSTVYYSNLGIATWPATVADNSFDIEDMDGGTVRAIKQYRRNLLLFKNTTCYSYSGSLPVRQISTSFGVHNENCIQEIDGLIYGVGPQGIFVTNGVSVSDLTEPVREYYQDFNFAVIESGSAIQSVTTGQFDNKFIIYMQDTSTVETLVDTMLVYDTRKKSWEVWNGWTDMTFMKSLNRFNTSNSARAQNVSTLWFGSGVKVYKAFDLRYTQTQNSSIATLQGGDVFSDLFADTGSDIQFQVLTKPYDLGLPQYRKQFGGGYLKVFAENPQGTNLSVIVDEGNPIPLGRLTGRINRFQFPPNARGNRCAVLLDESSQVSSAIINGLVFEDISKIDKNVTR